MALLGGAALMALALAVTESAECKSHKQCHSRSGVSSVRGYLRGPMDSWTCQARRQSLKVPIADRKDASRIAKRRSQFTLSIFEAMLCATSVTENADRRCHEQSMDYAGVFIARGYLRGPIDTKARQARHQSLTVLIAGRKYATRNS